MQHSREEGKAKRVAAILDRLRSGINVVEGPNDKRVLSFFGIEAHTLYEFMKGDEETYGRPINALMDRDKGGEEKLRTLVSFARARHPGSRIRTNDGRLLLAVAHATSMEQIRKPIEELLQEANSKRIDARNW